MTTVALGLAGYAVAVAWAGARWLPGAQWLRRDPRLGIAVWQVLTATTVVSAVLSGMAVALPAVHVTANLADLLRSCVTALRSRYAAPGGAVTGSAGAAVAVGLVVRLAWCAGVTLAAAARERRRHRDTLALVARGHGMPGVVLLDHDGPAVYCVPGGRRRRVVVTTGALRRLDDAQLAAVLAHERAHLTGRHHLVLAFADTLRRAFPRLAPFAVAADETGELVEMAADDAATRTAGRLPLAAALLAVAGADVPTGSLGAGASATGRRVRRLLRGPRPFGRLPLTAASALVTLMLAAPLVAPAAIVGLTYCPIV